MGRPNSILKRITDIIISLFLLLLSAPFMLITYIIFKITAPGPFIFKQERTGLNGKPFYIYKIRTMVMNARDMGPLLTQENDPRIFPFGRFLRRTSIDEVPQFVNVLKGEMSIIGPRPEIPEITCTFGDFDRQVFAFKPGITGYAQLRGRQLLSPEERNRLDIFYHQQETFLGDLAILLQTPIVVLTNKGNL